MNTISIEITIPNEQLRKTLFTTIDVEMEATKTDRGAAGIEFIPDGLKIYISAIDIVATRAITNSILRLLQTSIDVADSISINE